MSITDITGREPQPPDHPRDLCEIDLQAWYSNWLSQIAYLEYAGLISDWVAGRRRRAAYFEYHAALADLQAWLAATGC